MNEKKILLHFGKNCDSPFQISLQEKNNKNFFPLLFIVLTEVTLVLTL